MIITHIGIEDIRSLEERQVNQLDNIEAMIMTAIRRDSQVFRHPINTLVAQTHQVVPTIDVVNSEEQRNKTREQNRHLLQDLPTKVLVLDGDVRLDGVEPLTISSHAEVRKGI